MSSPPPPGLKHAPSSLPPRPPPPVSSVHGATVKPAYAAAPSYPLGANPGYASAASRSTPAPFTAFQPRSVASSQTHRTASPVVSAPPTPLSGFPSSTISYGADYQQSPQAYQAGPTYYGQPQYNANAYGPSVPKIQNPFTPATPDQSNTYAARGRNPGRHDPNFDPETEAQIAQWQSAYMSREEAAPISKGTGRREGMPAAMSVNTMGSGVPTGSTSNTPVSAPTPVSANPEASQKTVVRSGGGQTWTDSTLLEWDPAHFRLFVGNLAGEVTDDSLLKAFSRFPSVQKARVIRDKRTQKSKGYGFVSFSDGDDYFKAAREMQGKYIGSHPVLLRRATTEIRPSSNQSGKKRHGGGGATGAGGSGKKSSGGVKKHEKTRGGLKVLG